MTYINVHNENYFQVNWLVWICYCKYSLAAYINRKVWLLVPRITLLHYTFPVFKHSKNFLFSSYRWRKSKAYYEIRYSSARDSMQLVANTNMKNSTTMTMTTSNKENTQRATMPIYEILFFIIQYILVPGTCKYWIIVSVQSSPTSLHHSYHRHAHILNTPWNGNPSPTSHANEI